MTTLTHDDVKRLEVERAYLERQIKSFGTGAPLTRRLHRARIADIDLLLRSYAKAYDPRYTSINGKEAPWTDAVRALWAQVVAAHFSGETRPVARANYFTPRPYVDQYNTGSDQSGFIYVVGRDVCYHNFPRGTKVAA